MIRLLDQTISLQPPCSSYFNLLSIFEEEDRDPRVSNNSSYMTHQEDGNRDS